MSIVYLDGVYLPREQARVSVDDRGFLFGDGVYEVTPAYRGRFFRFDRHMARMRRGLAALRIDYDPAPLREVHDRLIRENGLDGAEVAYVYVQVTRGVAPRTHQFPAEPVPPTVYAYAAEFRRPPREIWERGYRAVTIPDRRWSRVDIKSIALLPNVLARQAAFDHGVDEVVVVRDGIALEGSHNNVFFVFGGTLTTHPATHQILHGITREAVLELARALGHPVEERAVPVEEIYEADEIFHTGTTTEIKPIVEVDGRPVGGGTVGPVTRALYDAFLEETRRVAEG